jgi:hypothetical protein
LVNLIKNLMRWANITKRGDDLVDYPVQQLGYRGKVADSVVLFPYGLHANVPPNNLVLMVAVNGHEENRASFPLTGPGRPVLKEGEIALFNKMSGTTIILNEAGEVAITAPAGVSINGDLTVSGNTSLGAVVTSAGVNIGSTHAHSGVQTGAGTSGPPV